MVEKSLKLPNGTHAIVDLAKLTDYCLNPDHPRGRHKARVFAARLGLTQSDAERLRHACLRAARTCDASATLSDEYGQRYVIDFQMNGANGKARVRSAWIVRTGESFPRFTSCYVL